jgi:hypothetical protein
MIFSELDAYVIRRQREMARLDGANLVGSEIGGIAPCRTRTYNPRIKSRVLSIS